MNTPFMIVVQMLWYMEIMFLRKAKNLLNFVQIVSLKNTDLTYYFAITISKYKQHILKVYLNIGFLQAFCFWF